MPQDRHPKKSGFQTRNPPERDAIRVSVERFRARPGIEVCLEEERGFVMWSEATCRKYAPDVWVGEGEPERDGEWQ